MAKVYVTRKIPEAGIKLLKKAGHKVKIRTKNSPISKKELLEEARKCDALLCLLTDKIDETIIKENKGLKVIANYAVGYDNIDLQAAKKAGVTVTNTPGVLTTAVAEHTFALICAIARRIPESDKFSRAGKYKGWEPELLLGTQLEGKTLGIIGLGRIGTSVAQRSVKGMGMKTIYTDIKRNKNFEKEYGAEYMKLPQLLKASDFITLHVPLLPSTKHMIGTEEFKLMKNTAYLINTSRGPVVDEKALIHALESGQIQGAAIDVWECEPKLGCSKPAIKKLKKLNNIIFTPHTASATTEARSAMSKMAARNIIAVLNGKKAPNKVN